MNFYLISNMCASVRADFCRPKGLESAQTRPSTHSAWNRQGYHSSAGKNPVLFSVWKDDPCYTLTVPKTQFTLAVLNILKIFTVALIAINDYRPALQAVFSVVYTSVTMVSQYYFQCRQTIYRRCPIGAYTYHDYRSALQAVFSVIYMSVIVVSQHESSE